MKYIKKILLPAFTVTIVLFLLNCFSEVERSTVKITTPSYIGSVKIIISGPDMDTITKILDPVPSTISLDVSAGPDRYFQIFAYFKDGDPSAVLSYRGTATVDLTAGKSTSLPISLAAFETKLVMADRNNNLIVQIDDINGANWKDNDLGYGIDFYPHDIDFDATGRIYIGRYTASDSNAVIRIDNMDSTSYDGNPVNAETGIRSIAIDRNNNLLYYVTTVQALHSISCNGGTPSAAFSKTGVDTIQNILGMTYDENEHVLYIAGTNASGLDRIFKYDLESESVTAVYSDTTVLNDPWHVKVKYPNLYVANLNGADGNRILKLNSNLEFIKGYGDGVTSTNTAQGKFYGPRRFLAILNKDIILIDDDDGVDVDKLISMSDINGTNWQTYGQYNYSAGEGFFKFYYGS